MKKNILKYAGALAVIGAVILLGISILVSSQVKDRETSNLETPKGYVSLIIDHGDGKIDTYDELPISGEMQVIDALNEASERGLTMEYDNYGENLGVFVKTINETGPDPLGEKWWQYWVNSRYAKMGVSSQEIQSGDVIEFKFISGQQ